MRGIKKCPTIIYRLKRYRDTGIPRYFVTSSIVDNFGKNPTACESSAVLSPILFATYFNVKFLPVDVVIMLLAFEMEF